MEVPISTPQPTHTPTPDASLFGTRTDPLPFGVPAELRFSEEDHWEVTFKESGDVTTAILEARDGQDPPPEGHVFFGALIEVKYLGPGSNEFLTGLDRIAFLGDGGVVYTRSNAFCGHVPGTTFHSPELFTGGSHEAFGCRTVPADEVDSLVAIIESEDPWDEMRGWMAVK